MLLETFSDKDYLTFAKISTNPFEEIKTSSISYTILEDIHYCNKLSFIKINNTCLTNKYSQYFFNTCKINNKYI
jgi:hypothetical protein